MNNPFPWFGSKARLAKWIIHLMPFHEGVGQNAYISTGKPHIKPKKLLDFSTFLV